MGVTCSSIGRAPDGETVGSTPTTLYGTIQEEIIMSKVIRISQEVYESLAIVGIALDEHQPSYIIQQLLDMSAFERFQLLKQIGFIT